MTTTRMREHISAIQGQRSPVTALQQLLSGKDSASLSGA